MKDADFKEGQVYWLARPDFASRREIRGGHGYLWVLSARPITPVPSAYAAAYFKSVATGAEAVFFHSEMDPVEEEG
jgi:hypothetical protein